MFQPYKWCRITNIYKAHMPRYASMNKTNKPKFRNITQWFLCEYAKINWLKQIFVLWIDGIKLYNIMHFARLVNARKIVCSLHHTYLELELILMVLSLGMQSKLQFLTPYYFFAKTETSQELIIKNIFQK